MLSYFILKEKKRQECDVFYNIGWFCSWGFFDFVLSSWHMTSNSNDETNVWHKLLLSDGGIAKIC